MRKVVAIMVVLAICCSVVPAFAQKGSKGASARAMERASDDAVFHRVGDWFATIGKNKEEKQAIIAERKAKRAAARVKKQAEKAKKEAEKKAKEAKAKMQKGLKGMGR